MNIAMVSEHASPLSLPGNPRHPNRIATDAVRICDQIGPVAYRQPPARFRPARR